MRSLPVVVIFDKSAKGLRGEISSVKEDFLPLNIEPLQERGQEALSHVCRMGCPGCNQYRIRDRCIISDTGHQCASACAACLEGMLQKGRARARIETLRKSHDLFQGITLGVYLPARQKIQPVSIVNVRPDE
jgi:hypothetical protein